MQQLGGGGGGCRSAVVGAKSARRSGLSGDVREPIGRLQCELRRSKLRALGRVGGAPRGDDLLHRGARRRQQARWRFTQIGSRWRPMRRRFAQIGPCARPMRR
eukprot:scaffold434_cov358-Prasinococcus_capsulatus_cf.AAC.18